MKSGNIGMKIVFLFSMASCEILIRNETGTAFAKSEDKTYFFMDEKRVKINVLRPSPRSLLKSADYSQCNKNLDNYCDLLFQTFDEEIHEFLNLNLVKKLRKSVLKKPENQCPIKHPHPYFGGDWCCSVPEERLQPVDKKWADNWGIKPGDGSCDGSALSLQSKCCKESSVRCNDPPCSYPDSRIRTKRSLSDSQIHPFATIKLDDIPPTPNSTTTETSQTIRNRRAIPVLAQFAIVVVIAISAYFIGEAAIETAQDNIQADIVKQEAALKSLSNAVEFDHESLDGVVNQLRVDPALVLAPNVSSIPTFYAYMKSKTTHEDFDPNKNVRKFQRFYADHISELSIDEARAFETNVLQLQNNRLPLNKNFIIALRAKCLSIQKITSTLAQTFCNDLAFHATRWDSGLKFEGVGFELENKRLKSTIYSMEVQIPILYDGGLAEYDIINLGRFQTENLIRKIHLPDKAVITGAGTIRPLDETQCIKMSSYKVCPKHAIKPFSSCLQSIYNGKLSQDCTVGDHFSPSTCTSQIFHQAMAISMFGNGTMHYDLGKGDLLLKPDPVYSFSILKRKRITGTLFCKQSVHKHVTPDLILPSIDASLETSFQITEIPSFNEDLRNFEPINSQMLALKIKLSNAERSLDSTRSILTQSRNSTSKMFSHLQEHVKTAITKVENSIGEATKNLIVKIVLPIVLPIFALLALAIVFNAQLKSVCKKNTLHRPGMNSSVSNKHNDNRGDATIQDFEM